MASLPFHLATNAIVCRATLGLLVLKWRAYNILTLFRSRTLRSVKKRKRPWRDLIRWFYNALISATEHPLAGLRVRELPPVMLA